MEMTGKQQSNNKAHKREGAMKSASNYEFDQFAIPDYMSGGIQRYIENGIEPGDFLTAVICNDLFEAVGRADETNMANLPAYVSYFYTEAPSLCHGSRELMKLWIEKGGIKGRDAA